MGSELVHLGRPGEDVTNQHEVVELDLLEDSLRAELFNQEVRDNIDCGSCDNLLVFGQCLEDPVDLNGQRHFVSKLLFLEGPTSLIGQLLFVSFGLPLQEVFGCLLVGNGAHVDD